MESKLFIKENLQKCSSKIEAEKYFKSINISEEDYKTKIQALTEEDYVSKICLCISYLDENIVIHRLTGDGERNKLVAPLWSLHKRHVLNSIAKYLKANNITQGCKLEKSCDK